MILSVDYGLRFVGLATTDAQERIPVRHSVVDAKQTDPIQAITRLVHDERIRLVLVGLPMSLSGKPSAQTKLTQAFIEQLRAAVSPATEIKTVDETLTSHEAEHHLKMEGAKRELVHAEAARLILADYLRYT